MSAAALSPAVAASEHGRIPVLDIGPYLAGDAGAVAPLARAIARTCEDTGFLVLSNHGVAPRLAEDTFAIAVPPPPSCCARAFARTVGSGSAPWPNLSDWPTPLVEGFRTLLKGGVAVAAEGIRIRRALPHGHAAAGLGTIRAIGLDRLLGKPIDKRLVPLAIALIASRLISPASKLAT